MAGRQGVFVAISGDPNKDRELRRKPLDRSDVAFSDIRIRFRLFAPVFGFFQCNDTRNVTRHKRLPSSSPLKPPHSSIPPERRSSLSTCRMTSGPRAGRVVARTDRAQHVGAGHADFRRELPIPKLPDIVMTSSLPLLRSDSREHAREEFSGQFTLRRYSLPDIANRNAAISSPLRTSRTSRTRTG